ncbi:MAG: RNA polymerase sigma factor [Planctomycetota bacterium]
MKSADTQDLAEFVRGGSQAAFERLAARHADLVYGICLRRLRRPADAEDAAQAVFIALARKAKSVRAGKLASWLHGAALRTCAFMQRTAARRARREEEAAVIKEAAAGGGERAPGEWSEIKDRLDAELARLPMKLREAVARHYLGGRTYAQLATELGVPEGTVAWRVSAGVERLRRRLSRTGVSLSVAALGAALVGAHVAAPASLVASLTALAAAGGAAGGSAAGSIAEGVLHGMFWAKVKTVAVGVCAAAAVVCGGGAAVRQLVNTADAQPAGLNPRIMAMEDNTWLKMSPDRNPRSRPSAGCCFGGGVLFYFGGGGKSGSWNDVELYDPRRDTWTQATSPESTPTGEGVEEGGPVARQQTGPSGAPYATHTFQYTSWDPARKRFFVPLRDRGTWEFDPRARAWENVFNLFTEPRPKSPHDLGPGLMAGIHSAFVPALGAPVVVVTHTPNRGIHLLDRESGSWKLQAPLPKAFAAKELYSTYVEEWRAHLVVVGGKKAAFFKVDLAAGTAEPVECPPEIERCQALAYDSASSVVVVAPAIDLPPKWGAGSRTISTWALDVKAMKWAEMKPAGPLPTGAGTGLHAPLWYDPAHNVHIFVNCVGRGPEGKTGLTETWCYRYRKNR